MTSTLKRIGLLVAALGVVAGRPAAAQLVTYDLTYSGVASGSQAVGKGRVTIDTSQVSNPGFTEQGITPFVTAFSLTISGASLPQANGTFGLADYTRGPLGNPGFVMGIPDTPVDFSKELVSQAATFDIFPNQIRTTFAPGWAGPNTIGDGAGDILNLISATPAPPPYTFTTLDDPKAPKGSTVASGINDRGQVIGFYSDVRLRGFLLSDGVYTTITIASGINDKGQLVGSYSGPNGFSHGFVLSKGVLTTIDDPDGVNGTVANGINNKGQVVGYSIDGGRQPHGFLLSRGVYTVVDVPNGFATEANGINDKGQVVGRYTQANKTHGFLFSGGRFTMISDPDEGFGTVANGINDKGQIVGYFIDTVGSSHGFLADPRDHH